MRSSWPTLAILALGLTTAPQASPQTPGFGAASVKLAEPFVPGSMVMRGGPGTDDPGRITWPRTMLKNVLVKAYGVRAAQISGPAWIDDYSPGDANNYAITATLPKNTTTEQFQEMLQNLLSERFHLAIHRETKDFPGYELVLAPGGPKLKEAAPEGPFDPSAPRMPGTTGNGFPIRRPGSPGSTQMPRPGTWGMIRSSNRESITQLTASLGAMVNQSNGVEMGATMPRVVDRTGLSGIYEFNLEFVGIAIFPPSLTASAPPGSPLSQTTPTAPDPGEGGPSLFSALEKQLGLRLQKVKSVPVDILVVDHVDRMPTAN